MRSSPRVCTLVLFILYRYGLVSSLSHDKTSLYPHPKSLLRCNGEIHTLHIRVLKLPIKICSFCSSFSDHRYRAHTYRILICQTFRCVQIHPPGQAGVRGPFQTDMERGHAPRPGSISHRCPVEMVSPTWTRGPREEIAHCCTPANCRGMRQQHLEIISVSKSSVVKCIFSLKILV